MKIECPNCKLSGNIDDATVPATGLSMTCPRCKAHFTAERPVQVSGPSGAMLDNCPSCGYATFSEEKFAVCPKCGLVIADYHQKLLAARQAEKTRARTPAPSERNQQAQPLPPLRLTEEQRRKEEEARKKHGLDKEPGVIELPEPVKVRRGGDTPLPVQIIGWVTVIVTLALVIYGISGILEYLAKLKEAKAALLAGDEAYSKGDLYLKYAIFPVLTIIYALVMLVFGSQFLSMRLWSVKALKSGALFGIVLFASMELTDMVAWCRRASDNASFGYYATGLGGGLLMAALWILPLIALSEYLRSPQFEKLSDRFD
jgi:predicted Zn finger-like uncharacterized protein